MRKTVSVILILLSAKACSAQTFDEWFKQKKTQKRYLLEQIAAFQAYLGFVKKGYSIAKNGLTTIGNIKNGDFNLHSEFFTSLKNINPAISNYSKVAEIIACQIKIVDTYRHIHRYVRSNSLFHPGEINYINKVLNSLIHYCADDINELIIVLTANASQMKDDERLKKIDDIYINIQDKYGFVRGFEDETKILAVQRLKQKNDVESSRSINGITNK